MMLSVPGTFIEAIKYYREQNPGTGLREASDAYTDFMSSRGYSRHSWNKLTLTQVRDWMEHCQSTARASRFEAIEEMIRTFNEDYNTNLFLGY